MGIFRRGVVRRGIGPAVLAVAFLAMCVAPAMAADAPCPTCGKAVGAEGSDVSVCVDLAMLGRYAWRGILLTDGPVLQQSLTVEKNGFSVNVWGNMDLDTVNGNANQYNELDITLAYGQEFGIVGLSAGVIHYTFPNTAFADTTELFASVALDVPLSPTVTGYYDVDAVQGAYVVLDIGHSVDLGNLAENVSCSLEAGAGVGWGSTSYNRSYFGLGRDAIIDFHAGVSLPVVISDLGCTIAPTAGCATALDDRIRALVAKDDNFWGGLVLSFDL